MDIHTSQKNTVIFFPEGNENSNHDISNDVLFCDGNGNCENDILKKMLLNKMADSFVLDIILFILNIHN